MLLDVRQFSLFAGGCVERASSIINKNFEDHMENSMIVGNLVSASTTSSTWYIDSGASSHMTSVQDMFTEILEIGLELEVVLGNDTVVRAVGHGTGFDRESMEPMVLRDVLYVLGLKRNLVSISTIEDRGLGVYVLDWKVYIFPKQRVHLLHMRLELDAGNCTSFSSSHIMHWHMLRATVSCVSYGTRGC